LRSGSEDPIILSAIAEKLKRRSKDDFKGRHFEAALILQAVSWYLHYLLSYRDIEEMFLERGLAVGHSTLNRWVLALPCQRVASAGDARDDDRGRTGNGSAGTKHADYLAGCPLGHDSSVLRSARPGYR
jgi:hypothetical protein